MTELGPITGPARRPPLPTFTTPEARARHAASVQSAQLPRLALGGVRSAKARANGAAATVPSIAASSPELSSPSSLSSPSEKEDSAPWPTLHEDALYGLAGEVVSTLDPHTEADPAAVLVSFLVAFGAAVNSGPHAIADGVASSGPISTRLAILRLFAVARRLT